MSTNLIVEQVLIPIPKPTGYTGADPYKMYVFFFLHFECLIFVQSLQFGVLSFGYSIFCAI